MNLSRLRVNATQCDFLLIALTVCAPFLVAGHNMPGRAIESDLLAMALSLMTVLWFCWRGLAHLALPSLSLIPLAVIGMIGLQASLGLLALPEFALVYATYLAWAALMLILAASIARTKGSLFVLTALATGLLAAALINAGAGWLECLLNKKSFVGLRSLIGQSNRLTSLLWLGILSALYLQSCGLLSKRSSLFFAALLFLTTALVGQRMNYLLCFGLIGVYFWTNDATRSHRPLKNIALLCLGGVCSLWLIGFLAQQLSGLEAGNSVSRSVSHIAPEIIRADTRISLWRDTLTLIQQHPLLGIGAGNFRYAILEATALAPIGATTYPDLEHSHNLVLQWCAEFGLPAALTLLSLGTGLLLSGLRSVPRSAQFIPLGIVLLIGIHSLLEYPLWFAEFLGPTALALGAGLPATRSIPCSTKILATIAASTLILLTSAATDYRRITTIYAGQREAHIDQQDLIQLTDRSIVSPYAYAILAARLQVSAEHAPLQATLCEKALRIWPNAFMASRCAQLYFMAGRSAEGSKLHATALAAFRHPAEQALLQKLKAH